jgi:hypothetical protein
MGVVDGGGEEGDVDGGAEGGRRWRRGERMSTAPERVDDGGEEGDDNVAGEEDDVDGGGDASSGSTPTVVAGSDL